MAVACTLITMFTCLLGDLKKVSLHILRLLDSGLKSALTRHTSQTLFLLCIAWTQRNMAFGSRKRGPSLLIIHYLHYHREPLYPEVPLIGSSSAKSHILPNYDFTNGPVKNTLTFYTWLIPEQGHSAVTNRNGPPSVPIPQTTIQLAWI